MNKVNIPSASVDFTRKPDDAPTRLSEDLKRILEHAAGNAITIREIIAVLHGRGLNVLLILIALPFCTPIPLPGLSTPFGLILISFGLRITLRKRPWLPQGLLDRKIPYTTLTKIIKASTASSKRLEKILHPRLRFFTNFSSFNIINGLAIVSSAFLLMLPLPIPFSNTLPAWAIALLAAGMMEEDGAVIVIGYLVTGIAWIYFFSIWWIGKAGLAHLGL